MPHVLFIKGTILFHPIAHPAHREPEPTPGLLVANNTFNFKLFIRIYNNGGDNSLLLTKERAELRNVENRVQLS